MMNISFKRGVLLSDSNKIKFAIDCNEMEPSSYYIDGTAETKQTTLAATVNSVPEVFVTWSSESLLQDRSPSSQILANKYVCTIDPSNLATVRSGYVFFFFFSSRRRHTRCLSDWSSDVCSSD